MCKIMGVIILKQFELKQRDSTNLIEFEFEPPVLDQSQGIILITIHISVMA